MAKQVVALEIKTDGSQAESSVKSLKQQLREAQQDVQMMAEKFGLASDQAIAAAKRAGQLKDAIGDAKMLTDAFNPDEKFKAFSGALQGVAGGFAAVQGAQALLGAESEDLQKVLVKVQSAMALSQGLNSVLASKDAFIALAGVIRVNVVAAFSTLKGAIISTGIGALIVGIGLLIEQMSAMSDAAEEAAKAQQKLNESQKKFADEGLKAELAYLEREEKLLIARAKNQGKSEDEILQIQQDFRAQKLRAQTRYFDDVKKIDEKAAADALKTIKDGIAEGQIAELEADTKRKEAQRKASEEADKKRKEENDKIKEANKKANEEIIKARQELFLKQITDEQELAKEKLRIDFENQKREIEQSNASQSVKNEQLKILSQTYWADIKAIDDKAAADAKAKRDADAEAEFNDFVEGANREAAFEKRLIEEKAARDLAVATGQDEATRLNFEARLAAVQEREALITSIHFNTQAERTAFEKANADARKQIAADEAAAKEEILNKTSQLLMNVSNVIGKETAVGKALAIASTTIDTYQSATKAYKSMSGIPVVGPALGVVAAGVAIASGIANVKKIAAVKVPAAGGGGGGSVPSGGAALSPSVSAPLAPQMSSTALNQQMINQMGNATTRAFVLESDVSGNQERIRRLNRAARIN